MIGNVVRASHFMKNRQPILVMKAAGPSPDQILAVILPADVKLCFCMVLGHIQNVQKKERS